MLSIKPSGTICQKKKTFPKKKEKKIDFLPFILLFEAKRIKKFFKHII